MIYRLSLTLAMLTLIDILFYCIKKKLAVIEMHAQHISINKTHVKLPVI